MSSMSSLTRAIAFLLLGFAVPLLGACERASEGNGTGARNETASTTGGAGAKHESGFVVWETPRPIPPLAFQGDKGQPLSLDDFRGKVVVLNIWATWCGPCREEMPTLDNLQAKLGGPDFEVLTLSVDQAGPAIVRRFFADVGIKHLRLYIDPTAQTLNVLDILGIPMTLLVDRRGRELGRLVGATKWDSPKMLQFLRDTVEQTKGEKS